MSGIRIAFEGDSEMPKSVIEEAVFSGVIGGMVGGIIALMFYLVNLFQKRLNPKDKKVNPVKEDINPIKLNMDSIEPDIRIQEAGIPRNFDNSHDITLTEPPPASIALEHQHIAYQAQEDTEFATLRQPSQGEQRSVDNLDIVKEHTENAEIIEKKPGTWIIALVVLCLGILIFNVFFSKNTSTPVAFLLGQSLGYSLMWWIIFHLVFLAGHEKKISFFVFVAIFTAMFTSNLIADPQQKQQKMSPLQKQQALQVVSSIQKEVDRVTSTNTGSIEFPVRVEKSSVGPTKERGDFGEIERFVKELTDRFVSIRKDYLIELGTIGWNTILDAQRIKRDTTLSQSKAIIEKTKSIVEKYEKKNIELLQGTRARINDLNESELIKREFMAGYDKSMSKNAQQFSENWRLEKEIVLQIEKIFLLLSTSKNWTVEGDTILFNSDEELAIFNSCIETIQNISQQQKQMQENKQAEVNQNLEAIKNAIATDGRGYQKPTEQQPQKEPKATPQPTPWATPQPTPQQSIFVGPTPQKTPDDNDVLPRRKPIPQPAPAEIRQEPNIVNLKVNFSFRNGVFTITNLNNFDWRNIRLTINSATSQNVSMLKVSLIAAGKTVAIHSSYFRNERGARFDWKQIRPYSLRLLCLTPEGEGLAYYGPM
jgi:hypothetical protein